MKSLDVYKIETDYSILHYAAERGFWYSFSSFILSAAIDTKIKWDDDRRFAPQVWDQYNDLLPAIDLIGRSPKETDFGIRQGRNDEVFEALDNKLKYLVMSESG